MKRLRLFVGILCMFVLVSFLGAFAATRKTVLRVTYNPMPLNVPSIVAKSQQLLEKELAPYGVTAEYKQFLAGYLMTEAMAAGELDIAAVMGSTSAITSAAGGRDLVIIGAYGSAPKGFALVVKADSPVQELSDLIGKKIALPVGTEVHYLLAKLLEREGGSGGEGYSLDDVSIVNMLVPDGVNALLAGQVDAAMVVEPVLTRLQSQGKIRVIADGEGVFPGQTLITASGQFVREHPELVKAYLRAHKAAIAYMQENPDEVIELVAAETDLPVPIVEKIFPKYTFAPELTEETIAALVDTERFLFEEGITINRVDVRSLIWSE